MIRVYAVGIHFRHNIDFKADAKFSGPGEFMSGESILAACAEKWKLRYKLTTKPPSAVEGHINYLSYTPNPETDCETTDPGSTPRVTFAVFAKKDAKVFPFFGQPLSLTETLRPIGELSQVLQYGVQSLDGGAIPKLCIPDEPPTPPNPQTTTVGTIKPENDGRSSFGTIGIPDNTEVRIRLLSIYCTY